MSNLDWLLSEHCSITRWSEGDKEYVSTFTEPGLEGLSGLGPTPHDALCELTVAYKAWVAGILERALVV